RTIPWRVCHFRQASPPVGNRQQAFVPQPRQLFVRDEPFTALAPATGLLPCPDTPLPAPFAHGILGLVEQPGDFGGAVPIFDCLALDQGGQHALDIVQPLLDAHGSIPVPLGEMRRRIVSLVGGANHSFHHAPASREIDNGLPLSQDVAATSLRVRTGCGFAEATSHQRTCATRQKTEKWLPTRLHVVAGLPYLSAPRDSGTSGSASNSCPRRSRGSRCGRLDRCPAG